MESKEDNNESRLLFSSIKSKLSNHSLKERKGMFLEKQKKISCSDLFFKYEF